jgi:uncharacterized protein YndB with AHSA1/START domain
MTDALGTVEMTAAGATIEFRRTIAAPVEDVWAALTEDALVERWLTKASIEGADAGAVSFDFGDHGVVTGRIGVWEPPTRLQYTWLIEGEQESSVEWTLAADGSGTELTMVHRTLPRAMGNGYGAGWHTYLDRLTGVATAGDIPEFDAKFEEMLPAYAE